ncbi:MAG: hypothetical protein ACLFR0_01270 [Alphaproteobacteria bacterium]
MTLPNLEKILNLISESDFAYTIFTETGHANTDYADFLSMAFQDFKGLLNRPEMTQRQLRRAIRQAHCTHRHSEPDTCWSSFLAAYLEKIANDRESLQ